MQQTSTSTSGKQQSPTAARVERKAVYTVNKPEGAERGFWTRIGIAFVNRDGSLNVKLDALPVNGELHIRNFPAKEEDEG